jgi:hypothetical protein
MKRREIIALLWGAAAWPLAVRAQQRAAKMPRYWQAPEADNAANPAPYWIPRDDLGTLPYMNDPKTIDTLEVINPDFDPRRLMNALNTEDGVSPITVSAPIAKAAAAWGSMPNAKRSWIILTAGHGNSRGSTPRLRRAGTAIASNWQKP